MQVFGDNAPDAKKKEWQPYQQLPYKNEYLDKLRAESAERMASFKQKVASLSNK